MKHGTDSQAFHICDFCGMSSKGEVSMFISPIDKSTAICKPCVDGLPMVWGKVIEYSRQVEYFGAGDITRSTAKTEIGAQKKGA